jgi:uncharacterized membrane protein YkoI
MKVNKWIILPAIAGVITVSSVAMADDDVKKSKVETNEQIDNKQESKEAAKPVYLTIEKATELALAKANGKVTEISMDEDDNRVHYDIEIQDGKYEYELDLDAITGEIYEFEKDKRDNAGNGNNDDSGNDERDDTGKAAGQTAAVTAGTKAASSTQPPSETVKANSEPTKEKQAAAKTDTLISQEKAIEIALKKASGTVIEAELDDDQKYEIEIKDGKIKHEIDINAKTGAIVEFEKEVDDGDDD